MCLLLVGVSALVHAQASWETVIQDDSSGRDIQIDRNNIMRSDRGTRVAWVREVLSPSASIDAGYLMVQTLKRYDCVNRRVVTLRRRYLDALNLVVREESFSDPQSMAVLVDSFDETLWREVCQPGGLAELQRIAEEASRIISELGAEVVVADVSEVGPEQASALGPAGEAEVLTAPTRDAETLVEPAPEASDDQAREHVLANQPARRVIPMPMETGDWAYHGEKGPSAWGSLHPEWAMCERGIRQAPIDLRTGTRLALEPLRFNYRDTLFQLHDNGRALEVFVEDGLTASILGKTYTLLRMSFHAPSEISIDGEVSPLAVHFHHQDREGGLAIVAVSLEGGGPVHPVLDEIIALIPTAPGEPHETQQTIRPGGLLPERPGYFLFLGSLSTPPCTEGVIWVVMKTVLAVADEQIAALRSLHPHNARPVQAINNRLVLESR